MTPVIYIEGGGDRHQRKNEYLAALFRRSWRSFLQSGGVGPVKVVRGGGRTQTIQRFRNAVAKPKPRQKPLLLVDSEDAVRADHDAWQHLRHRDGWERPPQVDADQAFLMVRTMETWLVADREGLRRYFGHRFRTGRIAQWPDLEAVPRQDVFNALKHATAECSTPYAKGKVSFEVLMRLDAQRVAERCHHAASLLARLQQRP